MHVVQCRLNAGQVPWYTHCQLTTTVRKVPVLFAECHRFDCLRFAVVKSHSDEQRKTRRETFVISKYILNGVFRSVDESLMLWNANELEVETSKNCYMRQKTRNILRNVLNFRPFLAWMQHQSSMRVTNYINDYAEPNYRLIRRFLHKSGQKYVTLPQVTEKSVLYRAPWTYSLAFDTSFWFVCQCIWLIDWLID